MASIKTWTILVPAAVGLAFAKARTDLGWSLAKAIEELKVLFPDATLNVSTLQRYEKQEVQPTYEPFLQLVKLYELDGVKVVADALANEYKDTPAEPGGDLEGTTNDLGFGQLAMSLVRLIELSKLKKDLQ